jgi:hypothetical protein
VKISASVWVSVSVLVSALVRDCSTTFPVCSNYKFIFLFPVFFFFLRFGWNDKSFASVSLFFSQHVFRHGSLFPSVLPCFFFKTHL